MRFFSIFIFAALMIMAAPAMAELDVKAEIPYREDAGLSKTEYLLARGRFAAAIGEAGAILKRHPKSADAYVYRGFAYMQMGETDNAKKDFDRALILNPNHLGANKYRADLYLADGRLAQALEQLQVIRMTCGAAQCEELDDLERAINAYKKTGTTSPEATGD